MTVSMLYAATLIDPLVQSNFHIVHSVKHAYPLHGHDFYEIFIVISGQCTHSVNGEAQFLKEGSMVFIRPDDTHSYDLLEGEDCQFLNVNFYKEVVESAFDYIGHAAFAQALRTPPLPPVTMLSGTDMEALMRKSEQIQLYTSTDKQKARTMARSFLNDALTSFFLHFRNDSTKTMPPWFNHLLGQLQKKENFSAGLPRLRELTDRSDGHLNRIFKQYLRMTPTAYLNHLKLGYAKNLLLTTQLPIVDIAFEAGFDNLSHFYHLFKDAYGIAPGKIRNWQ
ncbi:AraC family transcriptional regulator [Paenibacillus glycanilyticus]|uniref:AraC family transcriptional regulator n=1 Tax=Paenibacillus glycanilyticus TaxID=126569 RepID=UPI00203ECCCA|nr:AraC family transcriptional regulator [Paenibacillus glycanilyticus]MCM3631372.1 AraC family transcriptional regulator [Paenibacillus glycanilyticus]